MKPTAPPTVPDITSKEQAHELLAAILVYFLVRSNSFREALFEANEERLMELLENAIPWGERTLPGGSTTPYHSALMPALEFLFGKKN